MKRGTTPTVVFYPSADLSNAVSIWVTFSQCGKEVFTLSEEVLEVKEGEIIARLTQEQTLSLTPHNDVEMQIRVLWENGVAAASEIVKAHVGRILKEGEIV